MVWSAVGMEYRRLFAQVTASPQVSVPTSPLAAVNA
jgi:hypothetical protein